MILGPREEVPRVLGKSASGTKIRLPIVQQGVPSRGPISVGAVNPFTKGGRMAEHMVQIAYNAQHQVPWHWPVPAYLLTKGIAAGIFLFLATGRAPRVSMLEPLEGRLVPLVAGGSPTTVVAEVSGDFHFAAAGRVLDEMESALPATARHLVIDLTHARALRFAALVTLERIAIQIEQWGGSVHLAGVDPEFCQLLRDTASPLDADAYDPEPLASVHAVLGRLADDRPSGQIPARATDAHDGEVAAPPIPPIARFG